MLCVSGCVEVVIGPNSSTEMQAVQPNVAGSDPHTTQMSNFKSYVTMLADPNCKDVLKLKATQELSKNFEVSILSLFFFF